MLRPNVHLAFGVGRAASCSSFLRDFSGKLSVTYCAIKLSKTTLDLAMPTPISYHIRCEKDGGDVKASYDLSVRAGDNALIASFSFIVDGKELIDQLQWVHGQTRFNGTQFTRLAHPDQDTIVAFSISSNEGWSAADSDILRGSKRFDDVEFSNS